MSEMLSCDVAGRVATLSLRRPPLHILDLELLAELEGRLDQLAELDTLQVVVLRSEGGKAFCAGVSVQDHTPDKVERMLVSFHGALAKLRHLDAFTLARVDGHCLGGGMELACVCDYVLASERSRFGQPEIQLGCFPPVAAALLPRRIGTGRTLELLLSGRTVEAAEAARIGFVDEVVAGSELDEKLAALIDGVTSKSAVATRLTKRAVRAGELNGFDAALAEAERLYLRDLAHSSDMREGIEAFLAKRPPVWKHA